MFGQRHEAFDRIDKYDANDYKWKTDDGFESGIIKEILIFCLEFVKDSSCWGEGEDQ